MGTLSLQIALGTPLTGPPGAFQKMESHVRGFSGDQPTYRRWGLAGSAEVAFRPGPALPGLPPPQGHILCGAEAAYTREGVLCPLLGPRVQ